MEVRIKDKEGYVDADWTIENGVMVVSPKEVNFEPKDGDVVSSPNGREFFIFKGNQKGIHGECYCGYSLIKDCLLKAGIWHIVRFATETEKKKLFDKLKEEGYEFDFEKKELVKLKWEPKVGETYFSAIFSNIDFLFSTCSHSYTGHFTDEMTIKKMRAFRTKDECQLFCDKLNQAIEEYEP